MTGQRTVALGEAIVAARAMVNETVTMQGREHPSAKAARGTLTHLMAEAAAIFDLPTERPTVDDLSHLSAGDPVLLNSPEYVDISSTGEVVGVNPGTPYPVDVLTLWRGEEIVLPFAASELSPIGA